MSGARSLPGLVQATGAGLSGESAAGLVLPPDVELVREARRFVARVCAEAHVAEDVCDLAVLLTSEAVTNAFLHGRSEARIDVQVTDAYIRVEVGDDNSREPQVQSDDPDALDGRGLQILAATSRRWGVRADELGKVVWFELARGGAPA